MKLHWIASTTLTLVRTAERITSSRQPLADPSLQDALSDPVLTVRERLISASVDPSVFWRYLIEEVVLNPDATPLTIRACEVALLRAGDSQLQCDQTAAAVFRGLDHARQVLQTRSPRLAEQLKLRYAPLRQAYEAYGPGSMSAVGRKIWGGPPPKDWWPSQVSVHAVTPLVGGAADHSSQSPAMWIEAMLTDVEPEVPEWLRLVYQLTCLAITSHTRASSGGVGLPWKLGIIPVLLNLAQDSGAIPPGDDRSVETALRLWTPDRFDAATSATLTQWWWTWHDRDAPMPLALKALAKDLSEHTPMAKQAM